MKKKGGNGCNRKEKERKKKTKLKLTVTEVGDSTHTKKAFRNEKQRKDDTPTGKMCIRKRNLNLSC